LHGCRRLLSRELPPPASRGVRKRVSR
jgi:hypothetical protein